MTLPLLVAALMAREGQDPPLRATREESTPQKHLFALEKICEFHEKS